METFCSINGHPRGVEWTRGRHRPFRYELPGIGGQVFLGDNKSLARQSPRSVAARLLGGVDPLGLADAVVRVAARTATGALPRRMAGLGVELSKIAVGKSTVAPEPTDRRFANRAWTENSAFRRLGQTYLACSKTAFDLVEEADLDWRTRERARFATALVTSTLAPTNVLALNPDAVEIGRAHV